MKEEFVNFVKQLIEAAPEKAEELMTDNIKAYLNALGSKDGEKEEITDNGRVILDYLQKKEVKGYKSKEIADELYVSSRKVSGGMRKLVADGYVEKIGESPAFYMLTEKGKNYNLKGEN